EVKETDLPDRDENPGLRHLIDRLGVRSGAIVPLQAHGHLLGLLMVGMSSSGRRIEEGDLYLFEEIARAAAQAIDHARLYAEAMHAIQAREEFIAMASHELKT